jgi:hypothetical protein
MPIPTLTLPATPVVIYSTQNVTTGTWACTTSAGTVLAATSSNPVKDCSVALRAASVGLSTLITLLGPSGNPTWTGQLNDMPVV